VVLQWYLILCITNCNISTMFLVFTSLLWNGTQGLGLLKNKNSIRISKNLHLLAGVLFSKQNKMLTFFKVTVPEI
jgi:hypothetical protein